MELKGIVMLIVALVPLGVAANVDYNHALDGCQTECGGVQIPYPFGIGKSKTSGENCSMEERFELTCEKGSILELGAFRVTFIDITKGQLEMMAPVSKKCRNGRIEETELTSFPSFTVSTNDNKFVSVGCVTFGYLNSFFDDTNYSTGCFSRCHGNISHVVDGICSGFGCCQMDIPPNMVNISFQADSFDNFIQSSSFNNCSYSFLVKNGNYTFSKEHLEKLPFDMVPVILHWKVGNETCKASKRRGTYACNRNSMCVNSNSSESEYLCRCMEGFEGNPYHPNGCIDIDECERGNHLCPNDHVCYNTIGSYECICPRGKFEDGKGRCKLMMSRPSRPSFSIGVVSLGPVIILLGGCLLYKHIRKRIIKKRKDKFFKRNGGLLLKQKLSSGQEKLDKVVLFSLNELESATDNFNLNRVLGKGGQGTVYKGMLVDGKIVAVKKFRVQGNTEEFINEFLVLSQINHRNVVKLLGCCLEAEVPLLVYEFIPNGNLFEYLHEQNEDLPMTWGMRLRIASEIAGALFYLHSFASQPIYHRDIKSTNILLDEKYRAKVADFGTSRIVSAEATHLTTVVRGTFGYLDPEYFQTSQFTDKSDVYSFGVVLVELLTGQKAISSIRTDEKRGLALFFVVCMEENRVFETVDRRVMEEGEKEHIIAVANLAYRCLELNGRKRPTMKEVTLELEGILRLDYWKGGGVAQENYEEVELHRNEDNQLWDRYSSLSETLYTTTGSSRELSEVMPILKIQ